MSTVNGLVHVLSDVYLGNLIEECVVIIEDNVAYITAMDMSSSLFVHTKGEVEFKDDTIGISNLGLFIKYLNSLKDMEVKFKRKDNKLTVKPKAGATVNYILADVDLVPTYDEAWQEEGDVIANEVEGFKKGSALKLTQEPIDEFLRVMSMFSPNSVSINIDTKGNVFLHGGSQDNEHQFDVKVGKLKGAEACSIKVFGKHLAPVLFAIDYNANPTLYIEEGIASVIVGTDSASWMLQSVAEEG